LVCIFLKEGKIGKNLHVFNLWQVKYHTKKIAVQIPHRECLLSKYTHHRAIMQNLHVLFCGRLNITAKNRSSLNLHMEIGQVKYHTWQCRSLPSCTHPCSSEAIVSHLLLKFVPDTHTAFIPRLNITPEGLWLVKCHTLNIAHINVSHLPFM
jgi:hypothetical protein